MKRLILLLLYIPFGAVQLRAQNPNAAKFPAAVVADADIGVAKNRARALLTGGINAADLTINVDNGAAFASPSWGGIEQEYIKICSVAGNVITVCAGGRGAFGTTAAAHVSGAALTGPLLDQHVNQLAAEVKAIETALGINPDYVKGASALTGGNRIAYSSDTGKVGQSSATISSAGTVTIPSGQALSMLSGGTNMQVVTANGGLWVTGDAGSATATLGFGPYSANDSSIFFKYIRGTIGAGAGVFQIGQLTKTNAAWTHGITSFFTLGAERARFASDGKFLLNTTSDDGSGALLQVNGSASLTGYLKAPKQINFSLFDPNVALPASTIPGIWMAEYGAATVTKVSCSADTADAVIQIKRNTSTNVLSANLTCGNGSWLNTATFAAASSALGDDLGLQVVSGTAKRINVSIKYTQQ